MLLLKLNSLSAKNFSHYENKSQFWKKKKEEEEEEKLVEGMRDWPGNWAFVKGRQWIEQVERRQN